MNKARRWRFWFPAVVVVLGACQMTPPPPLLSPVQVARYYGYSERPLGPDRFEVTYLGPPRRGLNDPASRKEIGEAARIQATDLALWRAAQLAESRGFAGFRTSNVRSNVNSYSDDPWGPSYGPWWPAHPWPSWDGPYVWEPPPFAIEQAEVTFEVELLHDPQPGDYDAKSVISQLAQTYPGAAGPPPAPSG